MPFRRSPRVVPLIAATGAVLLASCVPHRAAAPLRLAADVADSVVTTAIAPGARLHRIVNTKAPWRAFVLDIDLRCAALHAMKGSGTAVGRTTTSGLLASLPANSGAIATINADFFAFAPPGVPTNLHVERGVLISGPGEKPVVTVREGRLSIDSLAVSGRLTFGDSTMMLQSWNRPAAARAGIVDARWGIPLDSVVRGRTWRLEPLAGHRAHVGEEPAQLDGRFVVRTAREADTLVFGDTLLLHLPARVRVRAGTAVDMLRAGDTVRLHLDLAHHGRAVAVTEAVGGRPIVLADSAITGDVNTEGNEGFRNLNPRTALGIDRHARRAWLVVIDGRQAGYSMGMTLRQVGGLMQALGATHALNLDGGGSSALAVREQTAGGARNDRVVNRPSDPVERPVGNALAVFSTCRSR